MGEVYRAMGALNFQWKVMTPYHIRCRSWNQVSGSLLKMSLQLYSLNDGSHLLDLKALPVRRNSAPLPPPVHLREGGDGHPNSYFLLSEWALYCIQLMLTDARYIDDVIAIL